MRPYIEFFLKVNCMIQQAHHLELPIVQTEKSANADIIAAGLHSTVQTIQPPEEIAFGTGWMHLAVGLFVICLLKDLIRTDTGRFDQLIALYIQRCGIDVNPANLAIALFYAVYTLNGIVEELRVIIRMFTIHHNKAFMPTVDKCTDLIFQPVHCESVSFDDIIRGAKAAIRAVVNTLVPYIQWSKDNDTVTINPPLKLTGTLKHSLRQLGIIGIYQGCHLFGRQTVLIERPGYYLMHPLCIGILCFLEPFGDFITGNKGAQPFDINFW